MTWLNGAMKGSSTRVEEVRRRRVREPVGLFTELQCGGSWAGREFQGKEESAVVLSRGGWQIKIKILSEQQADIRENCLMLVCLFAPPLPASF